MLDSLFAARIGPVPVWLVVIGGGIVLAVFAPKLLAKFTGGSSSATSGGTSSSLPSDIDPVTGVPYAVEEATDPATGLPVYYSPAATGATPTTTPANQPAWRALLSPNPNNVPDASAVSWFKTDATYNTLAAIASRFQLQGGTADLKLNPHNTAYRNTSDTQVLPAGSYIWVTTSTAQATGYGRPAEQRTYLPRWPRANPANRFA